MSDAKTALLRACDVVGGQSALARKIGLKSQGSISGWIEAGRVPAERVLQVETATDGTVTRHELRPDIYPQQSAA